MRVQPIRDPAELREVETILAGDKTQKGRCKYLMFMCGIYLARRICDMLPLRVEDLRGQAYVQLKERKTQKTIELPIPEHLQKVLRRELKGLPGEQPIFLSRQRGAGGEAKAISYKTAYLYAKEIGRQAGLPYNVGTHTMRKTFGYHYYQRTKDIATLMVLFNHSDEKTTKIYIGIELDELTAAVANFRF